MRWYVVSNRQLRDVRSQDITLFDEHVLNYSDDTHFKGYQSDPDALLQRSLTASKNIRGEKLTEVDDLLAYQKSIIEQKRDALMRVLDQDDYEKYHIDDRVLKSFTRKLVDDYAIMDRVSVDASWMSVNDRQTHYYEHGDEALTYVTAGDIIQAYDFDDKDEMLRRMKDKGYLSQDATENDIAVHPKDGFGYVDQDVFMTGIYEDVLYRGKPVTEIVGFIDSGHTRVYDKDVREDYRAVSANSTSELTNQGIFEIENGDVYRYSLDRSKVQKMTGENSVQEALDHTELHSRLANSRRLTFYGLDNQIKQDTLRGKDLNLHRLGVDVEKKPKVVEPPKFESVNPISISKDDKDVEDDLEL